MSEAWKGFWLSAEGEAPWASQRTALCQPSASSAAASSSSADDGLSVDDALLLAGGFGRAQRRLMFTMCFYYGLGSTVTLLPVFLLRPPWSTLSAGSKGRLDLKHGSFIY